MSYHKLDTSQVWAGLLCIFIKLSLILLKLSTNFVLLYSAFLKIPSRFMLMIVVSMLTNIRTFWWHAIFWTLLHLNCKNVCLCSSTFSCRSAPSATPRKPILYTVFQTSYFFPPISFPVKFQNYIFFERRFINSVARHYIVYNFPVTSFSIHWKSHYLYPSKNTLCL